jgi:hypothetical protein
MNFSVIHDWKEHLLTSKIYRLHRMKIMAIFKKYVMQKTAYFLAILEAKILSVQTLQTLQLSQA